LKKKYWAPAHIGFGVSLGFKKTIGLKEESSLKILGSRYIYSPSRYIHNFILITVRQTYFLVFLFFN